LRLIVFTLVIVFDLRMIFLEVGHEGCSTALLGDDARPPAGAGEKLWASWSNTREENMAKRWIRCIVWAWLGELSL